MGKSSGRSHQTGFRRAGPVLALATALVLAACNSLDPVVSGATAGPPSVTASAVPSTAPEPAVTPEPSVSEPSVPPVPPSAVLQTLLERSTVLGEGDAAALALAASRVLFSTAPVVVVAPVVDAAAQARAASAAVALGVPLLLSPDTPAAEPTVPAALAQEVGRLGAVTVLTFGSVDPGSVTQGLPDIDVVAAPDDDAGVALLLGVPAVEATATDPIRTVASLTPGSLGTAPLTEGGPAEGGAVEPTEGEFPAISPTAPSTDVLVLSTGEPHQIAAVATARAAQAKVLVVPGGDPRASSESVQAVVEAAPTTTLGLGAAFGDAGTLGWRVDTAATGTQLPGGGQLVMPGKTYVALYGTPVSRSLGVLGEQGLQETIQRAQETAAPYQALTDTVVVPTLEIIATVAAGGPGQDGNYSNERPIEELRPLVDLAGQNGQYVVLDLQPGRTDFLAQAMQYEELLRLPHVGLALDPEWRLGPDQVHLEQIGQVDVAEVNQVVAWLADLTRQNSLPQKLLVLHQFQVRMISGLDTVDQSRSELAVLVHVDGQGSQPAKQETWRVLRANAPSIPWWGWKNFYDEDTPVLTPEQTMQVLPVPQFVSYQ